MLLQGGSKAALEVLKLVRVDQLAAFAAAARAKEAFTAHGPLMEATFLLLLGTQLLELGMGYGLGNQIWPRWQLQKGSQAPKLLGGIDQ